MAESTSSLSREITIASELSSLVRARQFVETCAQEFGFPPSEVSQIALAVDEACSNLIRHAQNPVPSSTITVRAESTPQGMIISIIDQSRPFDPMQVQSPDMPEYFKRFKKGGLGVHLMRRIMDKIEYIPSTTQISHNELRLTKLRS